MPGGDFHPVLFFAIAAWIIVCGIGVVTFRNVVHSAVAMVFCFLGVAAAYALLHAELLAIVQILIYVGAISVVILFAIMLTERQKGGFALFFNRQSVFALPLAVAAAVLITALLVGSRMASAGDTARNLSVDAISRALFNQYVFPFELVSFVLLAAMIGAILLARKEE